MRLRTLLDRFAGVLSQRGVSIARVPETPWLDPFLAELPGRLPRSYEALLTGFRFAPFELEGVEFYSNLGDRSEYELVVAALEDPGLKEVCLAHHLIPLGRPADGSYDPVCCNVHGGGRETSLVRVDHEDALIHSRIRVVSEIAPSFLRILERTVAA